MAEATSLSNLLRIRDANAAAIDRINGHLGSALGFKTKKGEMTAQPAVIVFVPRKVAPELLPPGQQIPKRLEGPGGLWCATDVVVGRKAEEEPQMTHRILPLRGAANPSSHREGTNPGSFANAPALGSALSYSSPDTPGMPAPSEKQNTVSRG